MVTGNTLDLAAYLQALGNELRLRIVNLLAQGELCVCHLVDVLEMPQPKISQHLATLRAAGVVEARREGKWMHYRLARPVHRGAAAILEATTATLAANKAMQAERARLAGVCCEPARIALR